MTIMLDCETQDSIYASIAAISGLSEDSLRQLIDELDLEEFYEHPTDDEYKSPEDFFLDVLHSRSGKPVAFDKTAWFHLTRTDPSNKFIDGLKPLGLAVNQIWEFLFGLLPEGFARAEWDVFRRKLEQNKIEQDNYRGGAYQYLLKVPDRRMWGPYAVLIRDFAFHAGEVGNHDYLRVPEIVEDICDCVQTEYKIDLLPEYLSRTKPCIVKFVEHHADPRHVGIALYYLYNVHNGLDLDIDCNTTFSAEGEIIAPNDILSVNYDIAYTPPSY